MGTLDWSNHAVAPRDDVGTYGTRAPGFAPLSPGVGLMAFVTARNSPHEFRVVEFQHTESSITFGPVQELLDRTPEQFLFNPSPQNGLLHAVGGGKFLYTVEMDEKRNYASGGFSGTATFRGFHSVLFSYANGVATLLDTDVKWFGDVRGWSFRQMPGQPHLFLLTGTGQNPDPLGSGDDWPQVFYFFDCVGSSMDISGRIEGPILSSGFSNNSGIRHLVLNQDGSGGWVGGSSFDPGTMTSGGQVTFTITNKSLAFGTPFKVWDESDANDWGIYSPWTFNYVAQPNDEYYAFVKVASSGESRFAKLTVGGSTVLVEELANYSPYEEKAGLATLGGKIFGAWKSSSNAWELGVDLASASRSVIPSAALMTEASPAVGVAMYTEGSDLLILLPHSVNSNSQYGDVVIARIGVVVVEESISGRYLGARRVFRSRG